MTPTEQRLLASRERMRLAMRRPAAGSTHTQGQGPDWLDALKAHPGAAVLLDLLRGWWSRQPLRVSGMLFADAAKGLIQPLAQRNPLGLMLGALLFGALLAWTRPWRWILKPALFAGLLPQLFNKLVGQVPLQSWLAVLASLLAEKTTPQPSPAPPSDSS